MTFLAPMAGIIAAAIAVPALIFFYLLKLRRRPVRVSSTLLWSKATHDLQVNTPLRWLRPTALFLLQLLALAAFIAALARPAIEGGGPEGSRIVFIIDRSASMAAADGRNPRTGQPDGSTRLEEAKRRAEEMIDRMSRAGVGEGGRRPRAMVVALAADARAITGFTDSPGALRDAVRSIGISDQPGDLEQALRLLGTLSATGGGESDTAEAAPAQRTTAYIFSDGAFRPPASGGPFTAPGIAGVDISLIPVGPPPPSSPAADDAPARRAGGAANLGIVAINARRDLNDPALVRLFVRVQNAAPTTAETTLQLRIGDEPVTAKTITVPALTWDEAGRPRPGQAAATFELSRREGGVAVVSLAGAGARDLLAADDAAGVVLSSPVRPAVLVVAPGARADRFLLAVLEEMDLRRLLVIDEAAYAERTSIGGEGVAAYDLIIFDRVTPRTLPPIATLSFGSGLPIPGLNVTPVSATEPGAQSDDDAPIGRFLAWRRGHPLLRHVPLDPIVVQPPMVVTLPPSGDASPGAPDAAGQVTAAASLAEGPHGTLIGLIEQGSIRRVIVGFELARSTLGPDVAFPVLMANAMDFLTLRAEGDAGRSYRTDEPVTVRVQRGANSIGVSGPIAFTIDLADVDRADAGVVPIGVLERAGLYTLTGVLPADAAIAVNLADPHESLLATATSLDIVGAGVTGAPGADDGRGPREIWHWFVLAGLLLACLEWIIYAWRMRP